LFAFFFSCIEGLVFNLGFSLAGALKSKRIKAAEKSLLKNHSLYGMKTVVFVLFYVGFIMLLSYPLVLISNLLVKLF